MARASTTNSWLCFGPHRDPAGQCQLPQTHARNNGSGLARRTEGTILGEIALGASSLESI